MKTTIFAVTLLVASMASADILRPGKVATKTITGGPAQSLYASLPGPAKMSSSLRTEFSQYKVQRSEDGLNQVVCEETTHNLPPRDKTYTCTIQKSKDGNPLPVYRPFIRMG